MNVTGEYQITVDEYTEALKGIQQQVRKQSPFSRSLGRGVFGWVFFVALAVVLFFTLKSQQTSPSRPAPVRPVPLPMDSVLQVLLPLLPWVLIFAFVWFFLYHRIRGNYQRSFDDTPALHRVRTVQVSDEGITMTEPTFSYRAMWAHYARFAETPNLFLLFISKNAAEFIPKRIFTNEIAIQEFRAFLERNINPAKRAFEVLPVHPPPQ